MPKNQDHAIITVTEKEKLQQGKSNFFFTDKNDDIDSCSYEGQSNTVKVMIRSIFLDVIDSESYLIQVMMTGRVISTYYYY